MTERLQPKSGDLARAVAAFDARFGEMERVLWCLSRHCREPLINGTSSPALEYLVWTIKSWWGVQGVSTSSRKPIADALAELDWSDALFAAHDLPRAASDAVELVGRTVAKAYQLGAPRKEFSLVSKALHWLLPWHVPVFDRNVREQMRVPDWEQPRAYQAVATGLMALAVQLPSQDTWLGALDPQSRLRGLDKYFWWAGGGETGAAVVVSDPWKVVRALGLQSPDR